MSAPQVDLLAQLPDLIADRIKLRLPDLRQCKGMVGGFDLEELKRQGIQAPAVLVSRLGVAPMPTLAGPHRRYAVSMAAFIVTRDAMGLSRDIALGNIASVLLQVVPDNCWQIAGVGPADKVEERVLVNRDARQATAALAAIVWQQPLTLTPHPDATPMPVELYLGGDLQGEVGI
ncbi:hypothetical protein [Roseinatronobacter sp. NSM]|uniref:hypothetical protein n=1 Tax=Roseinatronobacter sp. NSM TaxID=3457785 RepID=UPI0040368462